MTVLLVLILMMIGLTNQTNKIWRTARVRISAFQAARNAFERITANLSQATLNTYLDYYDGANGTGNSRATLIRNYGVKDPRVEMFKPTSYDRAADLQFVCGLSTRGQNPLLTPASPATPAFRPSHAVFFQCPLGHVDSPAASGGVSNAAPPTDFRNLTSALNAVGYYIEFSNENDPNLGKLPAFITNAPAVWRYRLMELNQPSQNLGVYAPGVVYSSPGSWFSQVIDPAKKPPSAPVLVVADNIVALVARPKIANPAVNGAVVTEVASSYGYDSKGYAENPAPAGIPAVELKLQKNQLPPLVQITLVAIDNDSAIRLAARYGANPPPLVSETQFADVNNYDADLTSLKAKLESLRLSYRVFVTDVSVPAAKWSN